MAQTSIRSEGVLRLKIALVIIYAVFIIAVLWLTIGSDGSLVHQLTLQLGSVVSDAVSDTSEAP